MVAIFHDSRAIYRLHERGHLHINFQLYFALSNRTSKIDLFHINCIHISFQLSNVVLSYKRTAVSAIITHLRPDYIIDPPGKMTRLSGTFKSLRVDVDKWYECPTVLYFH